MSTEKEGFYVVARHESLRYSGLNSLETILSFLTSKYLVFSMTFLFLSRPTLQVRPRRHPRAAGRVERLAADRLQHPHPCQPGQGGRQVGAYEEEEEKEEDFIDKNLALTCRRRKEEEEEEPTAEKGEMVKTVCKTEASAEEKEGEEEEEVKEAVCRCPLSPAPANLSSFLSLSLSGGLRRRPVRADGQRAEVRHGRPPARPVQSRVQQLRPAERLRAGGGGVRAEAARQGHRQGLLWAGPVREGWVD